VALRLRARHLNCELAKVLFGMPRVPRECGFFWGLDRHCPTLRAMLPLKNDLWLLNPIPKMITLADFAKGSVAPFVVLPKSAVCRAKSNQIKVNRNKSRLKKKEIPAGFAEPRFHRHPSR
jgi:hypothetical protein